MPSSLEAALCKLHQRSHCVLVSSGTVGLTLTMAALGLHGKGVAIPAGVCLNVPLSVHYAGATPIYCDIDPETLGLSLAILSGAADPFAAVLAVHAYGNVCEIGAIENYCRSAGIPLIEDVAAAQGAQAEGRPAGSFGIASVLSFGRGKIIDVGGGGAVLTNDGALATEIRQAYARLPGRTDDDDQRLDAFSSWHTQLYNRHFGKDLDRHVGPFVDAAMALRGAMLTRHSWNAGGVVGELGMLADNVMRRRAFAALLFDMVEKRLPVLRHQGLADGAVPWRANIFLERNRNPVLQALLAERIRISSWYPPAQDFLDPAWTGDTPVARRVGDQILNAWVNHEVDAGYPEMLIDRIAAVTVGDARLAAD